MNLKEFNLEKALSGEYEIYTRDGIKVEQLFYFDKAVNDKYVIVALINDQIYTFLKSGVFDMDITGSRLDLMLAPKLVDRWINVYKNNVGHPWVGADLFDTEDEAADFGNNRQNALLRQTIKIQVEL